jgi:hypothetical protein
MKSKNAPQTLTSRLITWLLPPLFAVSLYLIQGKMDAYSESLLSPGGPNLPYIPFVVNDYEQDNLLGLIGLSMLVVYLLVLIIRKRTLRAIVFGGIGTAFLLFMAVLLVMPSYGFKPMYQALQTLSTNDHIYQLIQKAECHHGCSYSYVVLECDSTGWMCHNYGTSSQRVSHPIVCTRPTHIASLAQNPITDHLELTIDGETQVLHPADDISVYPYSWDRCGLGLSRS